MEEPKWNDKTDVRPKIFWSYPHILISPSLLSILDDQEQVTSVQQWGGAKSILSWSWLLNSVTSLDPAQLRKFLSSCRYDDVLVLVRRRNISLSLCHRTLFQITTAWSMQQTKNTTIKETMQSTFPENVTMYKGPEMLSIFPSLNPAWISRESLRQGRKSHENFRWLEMFKLEASEM